MPVFEQGANMATSIKSRTLTELIKFTSYYEVVVDQIQESPGRTQGLQFPLTSPAGRMVNIKDNITVSRRLEVGHHPGVESLGRPSKGDTISVNPLSTSL